ncbi:MAG: radical SAM family heme chaperone HemW [Bacilli bacterium]|nr:radical SAM family heme chaperone HemW [Bacilli bacterium]MDD7314536.1 radical SAM family heme chaperone HemW [Bacilli bacterium]MDY4051859.1 radical SAM family heme chaperone HemW [Bacilli bacterium]
MFGLYLHIPFCKNICKYCDFYKMVVSRSLQEKTINYIIEEMKLRELSKYQIDTIYIGGGSPSSLDDDLLDKLLFNLSQLTNFDELKEFTIEFNPNDITIDKVKILQKYQVTRVSIGIQTFNNNLLNTLGRIPFVSFEELSEKIKLLNMYDIKNINVDLIYAIPGEVIDDITDDLNKMMRLPITHLSCYSLILEERSILYYEYTHNKIKLIDETLDEKMYEKINEVLEKNNFIHYETSNFSKPGFNSLHNLIYWHRDDYLGIGPGASSSIGNHRFTNTHNLNEYFLGIDNKNIKYAEDIIDSKKDEQELMVMMNLRLSEGINKKRYLERFNEDVKDTFPSILELLKEGLLEETTDTIRIPLKYFYISNYIIVKII